MKFVIAAVGGAVLGFVGIAVLLNGGVYLYSLATGYRDTGQGYQTMAAFASFMLCPIAAIVGALVGPLIVLYRQRRQAPSGFPVEQRRADGEA
jgi:hypothetical protein